MRPRIRTFVLGAGVSVVAAASVVACGADEGGGMDRAFDVPDAAPDAPVLPEGAAEDSAPPRDAGFDRGPFDPADEPVKCAATPCATQIVAGGNHFCALISDGTVRCWGDDSFGALGAGKPSGDPKGGGDPDAGEPDAGAKTATKVVTGVADVTQLSAASSTTCARLADGGVVCWGANGDGQLGLEATKPAWDRDPHPTAAPVAITGAAARVDVGDTGACAVLATGAVWCWGNDEQLQNAREGSVNQAVLGPGPASLGALAVARVNVGSTTTLALTTGGDVASWGAVGGKEAAVCGRMASISPDPVPNPIAELHGVTSLAVSPSFFKDQANGFAPFGIVPPPGGQPGRNAHACAIAKGEVSCWGKSDRGALCTGFPDVELLPASAPVSGKAWPQQVAVGDEITCVRLTDGTIQCCGDDARGRLGTGVEGLYSAFFTPASAFKGHAVHVTASNRSVCALVQGGTVECWGSNLHGELGTSEPDEAPHPSPVKVAF